LSFGSLNGGFRAAAQYPAEGCVYSLTLLIAYSLHVNACVARRLAFGGGMAILEAS
jgi:hypothetical protein